MIVIGVGNAWRGDDGAGLSVARRVRELSPTGVEVRELEGDATALVEAWSGAEHVVVVDAAESGAAPGTVRRFDARSQPLPVRSLRSSTHAFGVSDAVELARALDRLPGRLDVYTIEGESFTAGDGLSPAASAPLTRSWRRSALRGARRCADGPGRPGRPVGARQGGEADDLRNEHEGTVLSGRRPAISGSGPIACGNHAHHVAASAGSHAPAVRANYARGELRIGGWGPTADGGRAVAS